MGCPRPAFCAPRRNLTSDTETAVLGRKLKRGRAFPARAGGGPLWICSFLGSGRERDGKPVGLVTERHARTRRSDRGTPSSHGPPQTEARSSQKRVTPGLDKSQIGRSFARDFARRVCSTEAGKRSGRPQCRATAMPGKTRAAAGKDVPTTFCGKMKMIRGGAVTHNPQFPLAAN